MFLISIGISVLEKQTASSQHCWLNSFLKGDTPISFLKGDTPIFDFFSTLFLGFVTLESIDITASIDLLSVELSPNCVF